MARGRVGGARTPSACDVLLTLALHAGNVILLRAADALQENQGCGSGGGDQDDYLGLFIQPLNSIVDDESGCRGVKSGNCGWSVRKYNPPYPVLSRQRLFQLHRRTRIH